MQAAAYKLILDKMVGIHPLHPKCPIIGAGNKESDGAIVNRMGTAMQSRMVHLELEVDTLAWLSWANEAKLDYRAISYVENFPDQLHKFDPNHHDKTFACPRTWEMASKLIKDKAPSPLMLQLLVGTLSAGVAHQFYAHMSYCAELPSIADIKARPDDIAIPDEPAMLYATSHMVAAYLNAANADRLMRYIDRLPLEFGTTAVQSALKRNRALMEIPAVYAGRDKIAAEIF